jgi:hypothetical protein
VKRDKEKKYSKKGKGKWGHWLYAIASWWWGWGAALLSLLKRPCFKLREAGKSFFPCLWLLRIKELGSPCSIQFVLNGPSHITSSIKPLYCFFCTRSSCPIAPLTVIIWPLTWNILFSYFKNNEKLKNNLDSLNSLKIDFNKNNYKICFSLVIYFLSLTVFIILFILNYILKLNIFLMSN